MKKVKVILCAVVLSLGLSSAQAGNFIKRHPILSDAAVLAIGAAVHHSQNQKSSTSIATLIIEADSIGGRYGILNKLSEIKSKLRTAPRDSKWRDIL